MQCRNVNNILRAVGRDWNWSPVLRNWEKRFQELCFTNPGNLKPEWFPWVRPALVYSDCWHHLVAFKLMLFIEKHLVEPRTASAARAQQFLPLQEWEIIHGNGFIKSKSKPIPCAQRMIIGKYQSKQLALKSFLSKTFMWYLYPNSWQYHSWADFQGFHITGILQNISDVYTAVNSRGL